MSQPINFRLISDFTAINRRAFEFEDPTILKPTHAQPLVIGEWMQLNSTYKMKRGTGAADADTPSWPYFAEMGRYDTQAIQKGPFLYMGMYEADSKIMDATSLVVGSPLMVTDVTIGGIVRRALALRTSTNRIVGRVTRIPSVNGGFVRFINYNF